MAEHQLTDERAAFEAHMHCTFPGLDLALGNDGAYRIWRVENDWLLWQARAALDDAPVAVQEEGDAFLSNEQIDRAAKVLAECMDYPWEHMPEQGRATMRKHAKAVIAASNEVK